MRPKQLSIFGRANGKPMRRHVLKARCPFCLLFFTQERIARRHIRQLHRIETDPINYGYDETKPHRPPLVILASKDPGSTGYYSNHHPKA